MGGSFWKTFFDIDKEKRVNTILFIEQLRYLNPRKRAF